MPNTPNDDRDRAERDETVEALLHPDRSHHDELGRVEDEPSRSTPPHPRSSPREQGAAPIDITKTED